MGFGNPVSVNIDLPDGQIASQAWVEGQFDTRGISSVVTPEQYGAAGDGVTDDTAALQAALDDAPNKVFLQPRPYLVTAGLVYRSSRTVIEGSGDNSVIMCDGATVPTLLKTNAPGLGRCVLRSVKLLQTNPVAQGVGLDTSDMPNFIAENVRIEGFGTGHQIIDTVSTSFYSHFESMQMFDCINGIYVGGSQANQNTWLNPRVRPKAGGGGIGIALVDCRGATFIGANVEVGTGDRAGITGVWLDSTSRECWFLNPWIEACDVGLVVAAGVLRSGIIGGSVTSNITSDINNFAAPTEFVFLGTNRTAQTQWSLGFILRGAGTPEGAVTAPVGTMYLRSDGGAGTTLYVKQSGVGNTGWIGK